MQLFAANEGRVTGRERDHGELIEINWRYGRFAARARTGRSAAFLVWRVRALAVEGRRAKPDA
jgi:hypothetical protein